MPDIFLMRHHGATLVPAEEKDREQIVKLPHNQMLRAKITMPRNPKFHRKYFALLQMAFDYWQPKTMVQETEKATVVALGKFMIANGLNQDDASSFCKAFLHELNQKRSRTELTKSFEAFREWVIVRSGFYETIHTPAGPKRVAKSMSFANMNEDEFGALYKSSFNVCWDLILSKTFPSEEEAQKAIDMLLTFD